MRTAEWRRTLEGEIPEIGDRHHCFIFDALAAVLPALGAADVAAPALAEVALPATAGAEVLGGAGETALLADAGIAPATIGADVAGAGAAGAGVAGAGLDLGGPLASTLGDTAGFSTGAASALPGTATGITTAPLTAATPALSVPPVSTVGGPLAAAPVAPASAELSPAVSGNFGLGIDASGNAFTPEGLSTASGASTATTPAAGTTTGTTAASGSSGLDKAISSATGGFLNSKDLGTALSLGGLGMNFLNRNQPLPGQKQINNAASSLAATAQGQAALGTQLESYLNSGTLPPGLAAGVRSATEAAKATIRSGYASRGESGSSAEAQDLQAAEERAMTASQQVALNLLQQGASLVGQSVNTEGLSAQIYQSILQDALTRDQALGAAIGNFASSLAGTTAKAA